MRPVARLGAAVLTAALPVAAEVSLLRVIPDKIVYAPDESGSIAVTLSNPENAPGAGVLRLTEFFNLSNFRGLGEWPFSLGAGETRTFQLPYRSGSERYGREIRCEVIRNGKTVAAKSEFFNVIHEWWRVNQGSEYLARRGSLLQDHLFAWYGMPAGRNTPHDWFPSNHWLKGYPEAGPFINYGTNCTRWLMQRSSVGGNRAATEMPPEKHWYNITGMDRRTGDILRDSRESHRRGVRHTLFTINNMEGPYGFELGRRHPEWVLRDDRGGYAGYFDNADPVGLAKLDGQYRIWSYLTPYFGAPGALEWAVDDLIAGIRGLEADGVYFDGRYCDSGGWDYTGKPLPDPARTVPEQLRFVRQKIRSVFPECYIWSNGIDGSSPQVEMFNDPRSGGLFEVQVQFILQPDRACNSWRSLMDSMLHNRNVFRMAGRNSKIQTDTIHTGYFGIYVPPAEAERCRRNREYYAFANHLMAIVAANAMHPYGAGQPQYRGIRQLMTRYSEFYWHEDVRVMRDAYRKFSVDGLREVWWEDTVYRRDTPGYTDYYLHLVNTPEYERAILDVPADPAAADDLEIAAKFLKNPEKIEAWALQPYGYLAPVLEPVRTRLTPKIVDGEMVFAVPSFHYYTLVVIREKK